MRAIFLIILFVFTYVFGKAQCGTPISTFPYVQNFEAGPNGWSSGGVANTWAWGAPSKTYINSAGGGINCWVTGSLNAGAYGNAERSWVESPCFDFSSLQYPHVKFKIYWECENTYDGATFQYSLNGGTSWQNVGAYNDPVDCYNQNWFNSSNITNLNTLATPRHGWAGTVLPTSGSCQGGNGSLGWVTAQHCMQNLAGQPSVKFRVAFGAGTACNTYDGVAFDDVEIGEAPPVNATYTYACTNTHLQYQFTNTSLCTNYTVWNFDDIGSGSANTSASPNPIHTFSAPGVYNVRLVVGSSCTGYDTIIQTITTLNPTYTSTNSCATQSNGALSITNPTGSPIYTYTLIPTAQTNTTGNFSNLSSGNYTVNIVDGNGCQFNLPANVQNYPNLNYVITPIDPLCTNNSNGSITGTVSGAIGTLSHILNPGTFSSNIISFNNLPSNTYTLTTTDAGNNCVYTTSIIINNPMPLIYNPTAITPVICNGGTEGQFLFFTNGGTGVLTYFLTNGTSNYTNNNGLFTNLTGGVYTITITDANGCTSSKTETIINPAPISLANLTAMPPVCNVPNSGTININAAGGNGGYTYVMNGTITNNTGVFNNLSGGFFTIVVTDSKNCSNSTLVVLPDEVLPQFLNLTGISPLCFGQTNASINALSNSIGVTEYTLLPDNITNTTGDFIGLTANIYTVILKDAAGCTNSSSLVVSQPEPITVFVQDVTSQNCAGTNILDMQIQASGGAGNFLYKSIPNNEQNSTGYFTNLKAPQTYTVYAIDGNSCVVETTVSIYLQNCCEEVFVPNAFTPNVDMVNDALKIKSKSNIVINDFSIYNRYGEKIFTSSNLSDTWDGTYKTSNCEMGTYYYYLKYTCLDNAKQYLIKGDVQLLR